MPHFLQGLLSLVGRIVLCAIFLLSAVGNIIPNFNKTVEVMDQRQIPQPQLMLGGAIAFLILGSVLIVVGFLPRVGAMLLLTFLVLATYYFHNFWDLSGPERQAEMIQFMKNLSIAGAMLFIMGNGAGAWSLDTQRKPLPPA
jgi:putative oxidoreductase